MFKDAKIKDKLNEIKETILSLSLVFDENKLKAEIEESDAKMHAPDFWDDVELATEVSRKNSYLKESLQTFLNYKEKTEILDELFKIVETREDIAFFKDRRIIRWSL